MAVSALLTSALLQPVSSLSSLASLQKNRLSSQPIAVSQSLSSLQHLDDTYTPSQTASLAGLSSSTAASASAFSAVSLASVSVTQTSSASQESDTASPMQAALSTAELDGVQVVQWMKDQATIAGASQGGASSATEALTSSGATLVDKFAKDLDTLGSIINQSTDNVASYQLAQGFTPAEVNANAAATKYNNTIGTLNTLVGAIRAATSNSPGSENFSLGLSDSDLNPLAGTDTGSNRLSMHITNYNLPGSSVVSANPYDFAFQFSSSSASATVSSSSVTSASDGTSKTLDTSAVSNVETYSLATIADVQTAAGQSNIVSTNLSATSSSSYAVGSSSSMGGGAIDQAVATASASSESYNFSMAGQSVNTGVSASTDAAIMTQWSKDLTANDGREPAAAPNRTGATETGAAPVSSVFTSHDSLISVVSLGVMRQTQVLLASTYGMAQSGSANSSSGGTTSAYA